MRGQSDDVVNHPSAEGDQPFYLSLVRLDVSTAGEPPDLASHD
ncbi:MAG TPA: hypothetical protein VFW65_09630 [Pseudonocardiaceae bacterium]|nr:hypothetical protein [Pseudonocardiaceae bacterium]